MDDQTENTLRTHHSLTETVIGKKLCAAIIAAN